MQGPWTVLMTTIAPVARMNLLQNWLNETYVNELYLIQDDFQKILASP